MSIVAQPPRRKGSLSPLRVLPIWSLGCRWSSRNTTLYSHQVLALSLPRIRPSDIGRGCPHLIGRSISSSRYTPNLNDSNVSKGDLNGEAIPSFSVRYTSGYSSLMQVGMSFVELHRGRRGATRTSRVDALLCALLVAACIVATWPICGVPFSDDFSYTKTALDFARSGQFHYNGWAAVMLGWQAVWGALFIKLLGFSFNVVRLSMLPFAMANAYLFHRVLIQFGL